MKADLRALQDNLPRDSNTAIVDCTASQAVPDLYSRYHSH